MNYKTINFEMEAFQFYYDDMPDWFLDRVSKNEVILFNCNYSQYSGDEAFCVINNKKPNKRTLVNAGEFILNLDHNELMKMHPDNFYSKYEKNEQ